MASDTRAKAGQRFSAALDHIAAGRYHDALTDLSKAVFLNPNAPEYYKSRAETYLLLCDFKSAVMNFKKAILLRPEDKPAQRQVAAVYDLLGHTYLQKHDWGQARVAFSNAIDLDALVPYYWLHRCFAFVGTNDLDAAVQDATRCLSLDHENVDVLVVRARIYAMLGDLPKATTDISTALSLSPSHQGALNFKRQQQGRAKIYTNEATDALLGGDAGNALTALTKAIDLDPTDVKLLVRRSIVYRDLEDYTAAAKDLAKAVEQAGGIYPEAQHHYCLTLNDVAVKLIGEKRYDEAIPYLNKAIKGSPKICGFYINRGDSYRQLANLDLAKADYHSALELDPRNLDAKTKLGLVHIEEGRLLFNKSIYGHAEYEFSKAIECNPRVASFYVLRGETRRILDNLEGAHEDVVSALQLDPTNERGIQLGARLNGGRRLHVPPLQPPPPPPPKYQEEEVSVHDPYPENVPVTLPPSQRFQGLPSSPQDRRDPRTGTRVPIKPEVFSGIRRRVNDHVNSLLNAVPQFERKTDKTDIRELARYDVHGSK